MPAAYEGTDIISCLRSKYIMRRKPYIILRSNISFSARVRIHTQNCKNIFVVALSQKKDLVKRQGLFSTKSVLADGINPPTVGEIISDDEIRLDGGWVDFISLDAIASNFTICGVNYFTVSISERFH